MCPIHAMEHYSAVLLKWNIDTCFKMDEPWKHAKWNKPGIKGHILYDSTDVKYLK